MTSLLHLKTDSSIRPHGHDIDLKTVSRSHSCSKSMCLGNKFCKEFKTTSECPRSVVEIITLAERFGYYERKVHHVATYKMHML